jgi:hypothetical protein
MGVFTSLHGRRLGLTGAGNLAAKSGDLAITQPCADASIVVGAENTNVRAITIQLKDANGADIAYVETVEIIVFGNAAMTAFAGTGGSTGIAIGTDGALLAVVAKKYFLATSEADGDIDLTWTDTGTESVAIGVRLPNGRVVVSEAFANT